MPPNSPNFYWSASPDVVNALQTIKVWKCLVFLFSVWIKGPSTLVLVTAIVPHSNCFNTHTATHRDSEAELDNLANPANAGDILGIWLNGAIHISNAVSAPRSKCACVSFMLWRFCLDNTIGFTSAQEQENSGLAHKANLFYYHLFFPQSSLTHLFRRLFSLLNMSHLFFRLLLSCFCLFLSSCLFLSLPCPAIMP